MAALQAGRLNLHPAVRRRSNADNATAIRDSRYTFTRTSSIRPSTHRMICVTGNATDVRPAGVRVMSASNTARLRAVQSCTGTWRRSSISSENCTSARRIAALPTIGAKPGSLTIAPTAKKDATASASKMSNAPKYLLTRAGRGSDSLRMHTGTPATACKASGKYVRRTYTAPGFGGFVKPS